jgi:hypothetical protein
MTAMNQAEFQRGQSALDIANRKRSGYIGAGNLNTMLTEGMQDPTVIGRFNTPYYMNERFANTPVSQLEGQISRVRANTNSIMAGLIDSGMSPSDAATLAQPMIEKTIDAESTARNTFLNNQLTTDKAKYEAMAKLRQDNDNELARVQQQFLINTNAIRKEMGQATGQWFKDQKDLIENKYKQQEELRKNYLTNEQTLGFKGLDLKSGLSTVYNNMQKAEQDRLDRMNEIVNKNLQADKTAAADAAKKAAKTAAAQTNAAATSVTTGAASTPAAPANTAQSIAAKYTALLSDPNINVNRGLRAAKNKYDQTEQIQFAANQVEPQIADIPDQFKDLARKYAIQDRWGEGANINSGIKENILKAISEIDPSITSPSIDKVQKYWQDNINKINSLMTNYPKTVEKAISGEFNREDFKVSPEKAIARNVLLQYGDKASRSNKNILGGSNNSKMQEGNLIDNIITPIKDLGIPDDYVPTATAYKYMTGRSIEDLMLYAANKVDQSIGIDKQKYDAPGAHLNEWKAQKVAVLKLMADKPTEFKNILDKILKNENVEPPAAATTTSPTTTPSAILSKKQ